MIVDGINQALARRIGKIRSISAFMTDQCNPNWGAILKVLPGAAAEPAVSLVTFGLDDVVRGYLRPRGLRGARKLRSRQRWYNRPTIPEIAEEIGKRLPGADVVKSRSYGTLERIAWLADGAIQRALYYVLIFDFVADTWYNAVSSLRKQGYCSTALQPRGDKPYIEWHGQRENWDQWRYATTVRQAGYWRRVWLTEWLQIIRQQQGPATIVLTGEHWGADPHVSIIQVGAWGQTLTGQYVDEQLTTSVVLPGENMRRWSLALSTDQPSIRVQARWIAPPPPPGPFGFPGGRLVIDDLTLIG